MNVNLTLDLPPEAEERLRAKARIFPLRSAKGSPLISTAAAFSIDTL